MITGFDAFVFGIEQESAESTRDVMIGDKLQVKLIEFETLRELPMQLVHQIEKLEENRSVTRSLRCSIQITTMRKSMTESQPLLLHEHPESFQRPVVGIHADLCNAHQLGRYIPSILQSQHNGGSIEIHQIDNGSRQL